MCVRQKFLRYLRVKYYSEQDLEGRVEVQQHKTGPINVVVKK
jgi:hypothetical protein